MKTKYFIQAFALAGVLTLSGCDDFLEQNNTHDLNQQTFFDSEAALRAATAPSTITFGQVSMTNFIMVWATDAPTT